MSQTENYPIDLNELILEYGGVVYSVINKMVKKPEMAEDIAQDVWVEILKSLPTFKGKSKLSTWIYRIKTRTVLSYLKSDAVYSERFINYFFSMDKSHHVIIGFYELYDKPETDKFTWTKERCNKCLTAFLHCLKKEARIILILHDIAELSYREIAEIMEKDEANIRQIVSRSRKRVYSFLDDNCILYNPNGKCRCRIKKYVLESNICDEYQKLREAIKNLTVFKGIDIMLPPYNFWDNL